MKKPATPYAIALPPICGWNESSKIPRPVDAAVARIMAGMGNMVAAGDRRREVAAGAAQRPQEMAEVDQLLGDDMDDPSLALELAPHAHQPAGQHDAAEAVVDARPDHDVGDPGLVLQGCEDDTARGARTLA